MAETVDRGDSVDVYERALVIKQDLGKSDQNETCQFLPYKRTQERNDAHRYSKNFQS